MSALLTRAPAHDAPDRLDVWARAAIELLCDLEVGRRPRRQVDRLLTPRLAATIAGRWTRRGPRARVLCVRGERTGTDTYEATAVLRRGTRVTALAVRLRRAGGRWWVDRAVRPEDGPLAPPAWWTPWREPDPAPRGAAEWLPAAAAATLPRNARRSLRSKTPGAPDSGTAPRGRPDPAVAGCDAGAGC